jgi:hypothetical protein
MKSRFVDPFFPNRPVDDPARFSGRNAQVDEAIDSLFQIKNSNPKHTIITGDRGIGKSSLLYQVNLVAVGDNRLPDRLGIDTGAGPFDFAVSWHDASTGQNAFDLASGLLRDIQSKVSNLISKFSIDVSLGGFVNVKQADQSESTISELVIRFCAEVEKATCAALDKGKDGLLMFVDELDRVDPEGGVASFYKLASEKLSRDGVKQAGFMSAGITGAIQNLETDHGSIYRTFRDIPIPLLEDDEVSAIIKGGCDKVGATLDTTVLKMVYDVSGGFPEPVHLLGSEMLSVSADDHIDVQDFEDAKVKVISDVRRNKLSSLLRNAGTGKYQKILQAMASCQSKDVPLSFISSHIGYEQNEYSSNMGKLIERGVIARSYTDIYSFVDPLLKEYINKFGIIDSPSDSEGEA